MNTVLWTEVKDIFEKAVELNEEERYSYLRERCKGNFHLFSEVESLLDSFGRAGTFIEHGALFSGKNDEDNDPLIGRIVGKYKIIKILASGGMGRVYLGERSDQQYLKQVAVKLINPGIYHGVIIKRFRNERQALANLDHPNIAKLLDGGATENGIPYFIMEYIEGEPVDKYCDINKLKIHQRLELFRTICSAVHFAHQNLIVHRDIKPENIIVTKDGVPKLLDFGIAKILNSTSEDYIYDGLTRQGTWQLTPEYASPEQILGENVTTSTDIYSLGVLLYVLLTGHRPYKFHNSNPGEINKVITEVHPEKPSVIVTSTEEIILKNGEVLKINPEKISGNRGETPDRLRKILSGDLDNIIKAALRKEASRRYLSVQQFSDDILKYLQGRPIIARHDTFRYRTNKFITRHKVGFISFLIIIFLCVSGIMAVLWQAEAANKQRDIAQKEAQKAEAVKNFIQEMLSAADPGISGKDVKVYDLLKDASRKVDNELKKQPGVQAELFATIGNVYEGLGIYEEANTNFRKALHLNKNLHSDKSIEYAGSLKDIALLKHYEGEISEADSLYRLSINIYRSLPLVKPSDYAEVLNDYGILLCDESKFDESEKYLRKALSFAKKLNTDLPGTIINNLAITLDYKGDTAEAGRLYKEAYTFFRNKYGDFHPRVATAINNLAFISVQQKNYKESARLFKQALDMKIKIYGEKHPELGLAYHNYATSLYFTGDYYKAEKEFYKAIGIYKLSFNDEHVYYSNTYHWLGRVFIAEKKYYEAEKYLRKALSLRQKIFNNPGHHSIAASGSELGYCLALQGKFSEAKKLLTDNYNILEKTLGKDNDYTTTARGHLEDYYAMIGTQ
jgi:serine/threonine-protein kinase